MPRVNLFLVLLLLMAVIGAAWSPVVAWAATDTNTIPGLDGPATTLTRGDLEHFVALAYAQQITVPQANTLSRKSVRVVACQDEDV